jgi:hypothetical protein
MAHPGAICPVLPCGGGEWKAAERGPIGKCDGGEGGRIRVAGWEGAETEALPI